MFAPLARAPFRSWIVWLSFIVAALWAPVTVWAASPAAQDPPADPILEPNAPANRPDLVYVIQPGDNLSRLAQRFGTSVDSLAAVNQLDDPNFLRAGRSLFVPGR
ncbi:MAG: LysM peptidoglycan-binding domain-containing protein, partial [Anaerolineales bacterium]